MSTIALTAALVALVITLAQMWSTHKIEWRPMITEKIEEEEEKELEQLSEDDDNILSEALKLQRKKKEKVERIEDPLDDIFKTNNF